MRNLITPLIFILIVLVAVTYKEKYDGQKALKEMRAIEKLVQKEKDTKNLLETDWAMLTNPTRLQNLVEHYKENLNLKPIKPYQIIKIDDLLEK